MTTTDSARPIIDVRGLTKTYPSGLTALDAVDLEIKKGEILALLGPNGAGKTTLISTICGIARATAGSVAVAGADIVADYRTTRALIGLVPQELTTDAFETVWDTVSFSRGLFGLPRDPAHIERVLRDLSLWEKKDSQLMTLSGGMKRRVMIAKALSHEPSILFLDEPTAGVDVELRKGMWRVVERLRQGGVTIILTTHYIEEAEAIADRIAVINKGRIILVEEKERLMRRMGRKRLVVDLAAPIAQPPEALKALGAELSADGQALVVTYDAENDPGAVPRLITALAGSAVAARDIRTEQDSLEEIFVELTHDEASAEPAPRDRTADGPDAPAETEGAA